LLEQYLAMSTEFNMVIVDANERVETQQSIVRQLVRAKINLDDYRTQQ
jgi:hypothetical protein